jgi:hypothetical protein
MQARLYIASFVLLIVFQAGSVGCKQTHKQGNRVGKETLTGEACLVGSWYYTENNFKRSITFNPDHTGTEVLSRKDIRSFKWYLRGDVPVMVYSEESLEWPLTLNCEKNELKVTFYVYKKESLR